MSNSVLIIDGDPSFAETAQGALEDAGLTVHVLIDATLDDVRTIRPRVLMLSAELPRGSGFGICSRIRRDKTLKDTAILMTTSEATEQALARHAKSSEPANDYARKDISRTELVDRVGRLLALVPAPAATEPIPYPPPLPRSDIAGPATGGAARPMSSRSSGPVSSLTAGPVSSGTTHMLELWPKESFDTEFRQALSAHEVDPLPDGRATPEQRLTHLRRQVKQHELREKAIRLLWNRVVGRGQELARRIVTVTEDLGDHKNALAESERRAQTAEQQQQAVQIEFQTFENEIRRIFSEKDRDESALKDQLQRLTAERDEATAALAQADERRRDDERRLAILREELDAITSDKEAAQGQANEKNARLAAAEGELRDMTARLQTAEHVARERAEANAELRDQLDQATYEREQERTAAAQRHAAEIDRVRAQSEQAQVHFERQGWITADEMEVRIAKAVEDRERMLVEQTAAWERRLGLAEAEWTRDKATLVERLQAATDRAHIQNERAITLQNELSALRQTMAKDRERASATEAELRRELSDLRTSASTRIKALEAGIQAAKTDSDHLRQAAHQERSSQAEADQIQRDLEAQLDTLAQERNRFQQRAFVAEEARAHLETQAVGLTARQRALTEQFAEVEDRLHESRFATEALRNALDALNQDLAVERGRTTSTLVHSLIDRIERVTQMSRDALPSADDPSAQRRRPASVPDPPAWLDNESRTRPRASFVPAPDAEALREIGAVESGEGDDDTQILDVTRVD